MIVNVIGSSSSGNSYYLEDSNHNGVLLDLGLSWAKIKHGIDYSIDNIKFALVTHNHSDHSKCIENTADAGIPVYSNNDVISHHPKAILINKKTKIGDIIVTPIKLFHDIPNQGYLVDFSDGIRVVYITDTCKIPYRFKNVDIFIVESNFHEDIMIEAMCDSTTSGFLANRVYHTHLSLQKCEGFLRQNFTGNCKAIFLVHLSEHHSDSCMFREYIQNSLDFKNVYTPIANNSYNIETDIF